MGTIDKIPIKLLLVVPFLVSNIEYIRYRILVVKKGLPYPTWLDIILIISAVCCLGVAVMKLDYGKLISLCRNRSKQIIAYATIFVIIAVIEYISRTITTAVFTYYPIDVNMVSFDHFEILPNFLGGICLRAVIYAVPLFIIYKLKPELRDIIKSMASAVIILVSPEILVYLSGMMGPPDGAYELLVFASIILIMFLLAILLKAGIEEVIAIFFFTVAFKILVDLTHCDYLNDYIFIIVLNGSINALIVYAGHKTRQYLGKKRIHNNELQGQAT